MNVYRLGGDVVAVWNSSIEFDDANQICFEYAGSETFCADIVENELEIDNVSDDVEVIFYYTVGPNGQSETIEVPIVELAEKDLPVTYTDPAGTDSSKVPLGESVGQAGPLPPASDETPDVAGTPQVAPDTLDVAPTEEETEETTVVAGVTDTNQTAQPSLLNPERAEAAATVLRIDGWFAWWWVLVALAAVLAVWGGVNLRKKAKN